MSAAGVVLAACSKSDAETFSAATQSASTTTTRRPSVTSPPSTTTEATASGPATTLDATSIDIAFAYTAADSSGRVRNPYIAVWVEDGNGDLAALIGVWYSTREAKYLRELTAFAAAAETIRSDDLAAVSGATRSAGQYQLRWDGRGLDGSVLRGAFAVWVEAAREHGPHSMTSGPLQLGPAMPTTIPGSGELSDVAVSVG